MKIRELYIEEYKMFRDFKIDFVDSEDKPLDIVVLAGVNGSGKTTLLEYIYNFVDYVDDKSEIIFHHPSYIEQNSYLKLNYRTRVAKYEYLRQLKKDKVKSDPLRKTMTMSNVYYDTSNDIFYFPIAVDEINRVADEYVKTFYFFLKEKDYRPSEITEHFRSYMKKVFDGLDIGFEYSHLDKEDHVWFTSKKNQEYYYTDKDNGIDDDLFTINELSTGQQTLLSKVLYLYFKDYKDKVILIDEPELSLHPSWQNRVLKIYENFAKLNNCQIIIATHSPHIIGSAKNESLRILDRDEQGNIQVIKNLQADGRDIKWVLEKVMGTEYTRKKEIVDQFDSIGELIHNGKFDDAQEAIDRLEDKIGLYDNELSQLRTDLAFERMDIEADS